MKGLLKKYLQMTNDERDELEELYLMDEIVVQMEEHENLKLSISEFETILKAIKKCSYFSHICYSDLIERMLKMLECQDVSIKDIEESDIETLIELLEENEDEFEKIESLEPEVIKEIWYKDCYSFFVKCSDGRYILTYGNKSGKQYDETLDDIMIKKIERLVKLEEDF